MIKGMPGIGKTALAARVANMQSKSIFWFDIGEWSSSRNTLGHLGAHLNSLGVDRLKRYVDARERPDLADLHDLLLELDPILTIVLDDCQNASTGMGLMLKSLISVCQSTKNLDLILVGRGFPGVLDLRHKAGDGCLILELEGLDTDASIQMLKRRGIEGARAESMAERVGGHPLFLSLLAPDEKRKDAEEISALIAKEVRSANGRRTCCTRSLYSGSLFGRTRLQRRKGTLTFWKH
jgi:hypothetical protein